MPEDVEHTNDKNITLSRFSKCAQKGDDFSGLSPKVVPLIVRYSPKVFGYPNNIT